MAKGTSAIIFDSIDDLSDLCVRCADKGAKAAFAGVIIGIGITVLVGTVGNQLYVKLKKRNEQKTVKLRVV